MFIIYIHKIYRNSKLFARFARMNGLWKTLLYIIQIIRVCVYVHVRSATTESCPAFIYKIYLTNIFKH